MVVLLALIPFRIPADEATPPIGLDDLVRLLDKNHPRLAQAALEIEAAHGQAIQVGRYPNPVLTVTGDEINDRAGRSGIWSPFFTQEIVRRDKRRLSIAAAQQAIEQATYAYHIERFVLLTWIRQRYFEVLATQRSIEVLEEAVRADRELTELARRLEKAGQSPRSELVNQEAALARLEAELEAARMEYRVAFRRLATAAGVPELPLTNLVGRLDFDPPDYDLEAMLKAARQAHPQIQAARVAVERARLLVHRAEAEVRPNLTLGAGYTWQGQNRSHDWGVSLSLPLPVWNRNQGNIRSAQAEWGKAIQETRKLELELTEQISQAYQNYVSAKLQAKAFRQRVIPLATEAVNLASKAQQSGQASVFDVLSTRRWLLLHQLALVKHDTQVWQAAAILSGLMLEETWPVFPK